MSITKSPVLVLADWLRKTKVISHTSQWTNQAVAEQLIKELSGEGWVIMMKDDVVTQNRFG